MYKAGVSMDGYYPRCLHEQDQRCICKRVRANGIEVFVEQCITCGSELRAIKKTSPEILRCATIEAFDEELPARFRQWCTDVTTQRLQQQQQVLAEADEQFWRDYDLYLQTPAWKQKRNAVLHRANYLCEGCGERPAQHIHHTTYKHVFEEFLFELVAVCRNCHQRLHPDKKLDV